LKAKYWVNIWVVTTALFREEVCKFFIVKLSILVSIILVEEGFLLNVLENAAECF
jgi:hypothetical protein